MATTGPATIMRSEIAASIEVVQGLIAARLPLESIGAGTDIRAFLQKGVPLELSRAALRRAWVSDPAIRDFIEVAENQWDFATGSDIAGFGPLEASEEVRRMVAEMFHGPSKVTPVERTPAGDGVPSLAEQQNLQEPARVEAVEEREPQKLSEAEASPTQDVVQREENNTATQQERQYSDSCAPAKRTHGRALPQ